MNVSPQLLSNIKSAEGCKLVAYKDGDGFWTIGYGHLLSPQDQDWTGYTITQEQADAYLADDIYHDQLLAQTLPEWTSLDTPARQDAITECVFNLGIKHWTKEFPKTRGFIQVRAWNLAAQALLASPEWIKEVGLSRVARLAGMLRSGSYSPLPDSL
jgi:lysozyme